MKLTLAFTLAALLLATACRAQFDAPPFETAEEKRDIDNNYVDFLDFLVRSIAFKWANGATGTINTTVLAETQAALTARLLEVGTPDVRQCNRLSETPLACYACENGAENISRAEVDVVRTAKLYYTVHSQYDSAATRTPATQTFFLPRHSIGYIYTPTLPCRATPTCFPNNNTQLIRFELAGPRLVSFKRIAGKLLIDKMNLGGSFSQITGNAAPTTLFFGEGLVPQSIMDNPALMGVFCFLPSKRRAAADTITYYAHRGIPGIDEPSN